MAEVGGELIEKDTKTHQVRKVTVDDETTALVIAHREACADLAAKCGAKVSANSFLFSHEVDFSKPWRPNYATLPFGRLRDELGLDGVKLHHFGATQLLSAGCGTAAGTHGTVPGDAGTPAAAGSGGAGSRRSAAGRDERGPSREASGMAIHARPHVWAHRRETSLGGDP